MSVRLHAERSMSLEWRARSSSLAWSNPLAWWWGLLTLVSGANIAVWFVLYRQFHEQPTGSLGSTSGIELMLLVSAKSARMWERAVLTNRPLLDLSPFVLEGL